MFAIPPDSDFVAFWLQHGWDRAWGILLRSDRTLDEVRRHLRQFLRVQMPDGRFALFRFYDPRVLPTYLRHCTRDELALWFAGVRAFRVPAASGQRYSEFSFDGGRLIEQ